MSNIILGIESSCDDTSAAVIKDGILMSNVIASQSVHEAYGGVVPELASRAHQQNIVPVVSEAIKRAGIEKKDLSAIAFTAGPGLIGSLLVGTSFAKGLSIALGIPLLNVNHLHGHVLSHFIKEDETTEVPEFPYICLLISGGNSQIIIVEGYNKMRIIGQTIDDAAGEAFDKCAKVMGLPYPGGPYIDRLAAEGDPTKFRFSKPHIPGLDYSFSGLKTSFLYTLRDEIKNDPDFIEKNKADLAASLQKTIIDILLDKLDKAVKAHPEIKQIAIGGGVSANSGVRSAIADYCERHNLKAFIPKRAFTTDNAAMVAIAGYFKYLENPIERTQRLSGGATEHSFQNADNGLAAGVEVEFRKEIVKDLAVSANASYMYTNVILPEGGAYTNQQRSLQGASPYLANADISYTPTFRNGSGLSLALLYNLQGPRIHAVGIMGLGDVKQMPLHTLDFAATYKINRHFSVKMAFNNMLNSTVRFRQDIPNAGRMVEVEQWRIGTGFEVGISWSL